MFRHSSPKAAGIVVATSFDGRDTQRDTLQCVHCGGHWVVVPGSRRKRGWCIHCQGPHCGKPDCASRCLPLEKRLAFIEKHGAMIRPP
jgi:hypothetical protein